MGKLEKLGQWLVRLLFLHLSFRLAMANSSSGSGSTIKFLPGFEGPLPFELETGYIGVGESEEVQLFYYFVKSESNAQVDPVLLWMTGGPGCSSFSAFAYELGPLQFVEREDDISNLPRLVLNPNSWTEFASIIFLDSPVGTGFSYATDPQARESDTMLACNAAHQFLRKFQLFLALLIGHPEFISNPIYVAGDSFSGLIVPIVAELISQGNEKGIEPHIDLKGYLLGNPLTTPTSDNYQVPFAYGMGLISGELYESLQRNCKGIYKDIDPRNLPCLEDMKAFNQLISNLYQNDILEPLCPFYAPRPENLISDLASQVKVDYRRRLRTFKCRSDWYRLSYSWFNDNTVREFLQIRRGSVGYWLRCDFDIAFNTTVWDVVSYHASLSRKAYRSLIYSGDHDMRVPFLATEAWIRSLNYTIVDDWRQWRVEGQVAGYTRKYANQMTFATVKGGGHTAPEYRPVECKAMFRRWISHQPL